MANVVLVRNLKIEFQVPEGRVEAVKGVSFRIPRGRTVALVGESGSGKSVISQAMMGILPKVGSITDGEIIFFDPDRPKAFVDIVKLRRDGPEMRNLRGHRMSIIFQEPMTSLSPLHTIGNQIGEAFRLHRSAGKAEGNDATEEMLRLVGFPNPRSALDNYPFELSGGLRQRAMIAMALVCRPALLIADEPTTALDVTIQAQILRLMKELQDHLGMAILMITHDLGVVANMADEIVVLYQGAVMEQGTLNDIFHNPRHPYLVALLKAVPRFDMKPGERLVPIREIKAEPGGLLQRREPWPEDMDRRRPLLEVKNLGKTFRSRKRSFFRGRSESSLRAVDNVSFEIRRGECLGLVGESGCGKTTASKMIMRAMSADSGQVTFNDRGKSVDVLNMTKKQLAEYRRRVQYIFQDPFGSLNPRKKVGTIIEEPLVINRDFSKSQRRELVRARTKWRKG